MKYNRADLPKIIVLAVILFAVLVYIGISYARLSREHKEKLAAEEARQHAAQEAAEAVRPSPHAQTAATVAALITQVPPPERDPFRPVIPPRTRGAAAATTSTQRPTPPTPTTTTTTPPQSLVQSLHVTGIVVGTPSIAVLRFQDQHYVVREGDLLNGGLRVHTIATSTVTLRDNENTYLLRLGR